MRRLLIMLCAAPLAALSPRAAAAVQDLPAPRSAMVGVYTDDQARAGEDVYAGICTGCHTISEHTGLNFWKSWLGLPVSELFIYLRDYMPDDAPGSLSPEEYIQVIAYLLEMNRFPSGDSALPGDEAALEQIRIDTVAVSTDTSAVAARSVVPVPWRQALHAERVTGASGAAHGSMRFAKRLLPFRR